jgi:hypothetical protein
MQAENRNNGSERELSGWLTAYRESCDAPETSADFMPRLWERIESRNRLLVVFRRWTEGFVFAAAAACLGIVVLQTIDAKMPKPVTMTYVEALAIDSEPDRLVLQDVAFVRDNRPARPDPADHTLP